MTSPPWPSHRGVPLLQSFQKCSSIGHHLCTSETATITITTTIIIIITTINTTITIIITCFSLIFVLSVDSIHCTCFPGKTDIDVEQPPWSIDVPNKCPHNFSTSAVAPVGSCSGTRNCLQSFEPRWGSGALGHGNSLRNYNLWVFNIAYCWSPGLYQQ